ncbi:MAG: putative RNA methyltransferase [Pseudomonadota bacterium]
MAFLVCPLCRQLLAPDDRSWRCAQGHAFDTAREGYLNLLPVQQKKSRAPGDNPEMVRARRAFLAAGHYAPLRDAVLDLLRPLQPRTLLDIGCGEGWYTGALRTVAADVTGLDLSKDAVRLAAKQHPGIRWLVAGSSALPLADASMDVVTSLFSPLPAAEIARVLKPGGHLLVVTPGPRHLWALREALFDEVRPHAPEKFVEQLAPRFELVQQVDVAFDLTLDQSALQDLLTMTPYAWRADKARRNVTEIRQLRAEFALLLWSTRPAEPASE